MVLAAHLVMACQPDSSATPPPTLTPLPREGAPTSSSTEPPASSSAAAATGPTPTDIGGQLSPEAVNAVAPTDAVADADSRYVEFLAAREATGQCPGASGDDGTVEFDDDDRSFYFPDVDRLRAVGFIPDDPGPDLESPGGAIPPAEENGEVPPQTPCDDVSMPMYSLFEPVRSAWQLVIEEVRTRPEILALQDETMTCLQQAGAPPEVVANETEFLFWVDTLVFGGDTLDQSADLTWARIYADCGEDLFEAREEATLARRPAFVEEHRSAIAQLSALLE